MNNKVYSCLKLNASLSKEDASNLVKTDYHAASLYLPHVIPGNIENESLPVHIRNTAIEAYLIMISGVWSARQKFM